MGQCYDVERRGIAVLNSLKGSKGRPRGRFGAQVERAKGRRLAYGQHKRCNRQDTKELTK